MLASKKIAAAGGMFVFSSRRRHTRLQGDWSSDVCSSDLGLRRGGFRGCSPTSPARPHDLAQPYRLSLFVVRATDPAIGGGSDPMAPYPAQAVSRVFLVPPGADCELRRHLSALARRRFQDVFRLFLAGGSSQRGSRL